MTYEERNNLVGILTGIVMICAYIWRISDLNVAGAFDGPDGLMIWARAVLWLIGVGIVLTIITTILFSILHSIFTNNAAPSMIVDERDRMIGIWGMRVTWVVCSLAFIAAMFALAFGWTPFAILNMIVAGFAVGDLAGNLAKFGLYRFGS
jgi:hypothetical protein